MAAAAASPSPSSSSSSPSENKGMVRLRSSDGKEFVVEVAVAIQSQIIRHMIEDGCINDDGVPLPNVKADVLSRIIDYCKKHAELSADDCRLKSWDAEFTNVDQVVLLNLMMAANYLDIEQLLKLIAQAVANRIRGKTPDEIRRALDIENDFTPEEEEEIRSNNSWAFE